MTRDELTQIIRKQQIEINLCKTMIEDLEKKNFLQEKELRKEIVKAQEKASEIYEQRNDDNEKLLKSYHEKKVQIINFKY